MKIAITSEGGGMEGTVAEHFGRCPEFVLVEIEGKEIKSAKGVPNPYDGKHIPGAVPRFVKDQGAEIVITGGCGPMAIKLFDELGVRLVMGARGRISDTVSDFLKGRLKQDENACSH